MKVTEQMINVAARELPPVRRADIRRAIEAVLELMPSTSEDVIDEPVEIGARVQDCDDDVWTKIGDDAWRFAAGELTWPWRSVRNCAPLRRLP